VAKNFKDLSEILALAISSEETDARIYPDYAEGLKADYPVTSQIFEEMGGGRE
jgi:rubrerythrin